MLSVRPAAAAVRILVMFSSYSSPMRVPVGCLGHLFRERYVFYQSKDAVVSPEIARRPRRTYRGCAAYHIKEVTIILIRNYERAGESIR